MSTAAYADGYAIDTARTQAGHFQPEIQGLRAISVLAVIFAHAGFLGLPGGFTGVDVFFVISGFLITRLLLAELQATGRIDVVAFWAKRARRLLPNAFAALTGTVLLAVFLFPGYPLDTLAEEVTHAALEIVNFHFADKAVDYFRSDGPISPVLHFWSLSVEEQFYLIWPLLLLGVSLAFPGGNRRAVLLLALIWCASFAANIIITSTEQPLAYFGTGTRVWQLATGGLLAAGWIGVERLPSLVRVAMAWIGFAAILAAFLLLDGGDYPGFPALLPTLGAAALIAGFGAAAPHSLLRRGLSATPMQWIGSLSYSWYLWHWPLLILPRLVYPDTPYIEATAVPASLLLAWAAYTFIELPVHKGHVLATRTPTQTLTVAAAAFAAVISVAYLAMPMLHLIDSRLAARAAHIEAASNDRSLASKEGCFLERHEVAQRPCVYGALQGQRRVVLFGDSHADHWFPALNAGARQAGWQLMSWTRAGCSSATITQHLEDKPYLLCDQWREGILKKLTEGQVPDLVILSNRVNYEKKSIYDAATGRLLSAEKGELAWREGLRKTIQRLTGAGVKVLIIRDTPRMDKDYRSCLLTGDTCPTLRSKALGSPMADAEIAREFPSVALADFSDDICDSKSCPAIRNGVIRYRDSTHISATYAESFAPHMARLLQSFGQ